MPVARPQDRFTSTHTLGATLERDRLERRVRWMTAAVDALRRRATESGREPPRHVRQAITDFDTQIAALLRRHRALAATEDQPTSRNGVVGEQGR
jgi:hypothetical protein